MFIINTITYVLIKNVHTFINLVILNNIAGSIINY